MLQEVRYRSFHSTNSLGETQAYEVVLCELRFETQGQLTVAPDFTKPATKPYRWDINVLGTCIKNTFKM